MNSWAKKKVKSLSRKRCYILLMLRYHLQFKKLKKLRKKHKEERYTRLLSLNFKRRPQIKHKIFHRPLRIECSKLELKRAIYRIQLLNDIKEKDLILNVDEWTINRETLPLRSWRYIGLGKSFEHLILKICLHYFSNIFRRFFLSPYLHAKTIHLESFVEFFFKTIFRSSWEQIDLIKTDE